MDKRLLLSAFLTLLFAFYVFAQHENLIVPYYSGKNTSLSPVASAPNPATSPIAPAAASPQGAATAVAGQMYKDGQYTGSVQDAYYGNVQVRATMQGGAISTVEFLQYPNTHQTSVLINSQALPILQSEAIQAQSANVNIVSGATFTSQAYQASLANALSQAVNPNAAVAPAQPQNATSTPPAAAPYVIRHREDDGGWDD